MSTAVALIEPREEPAKAAERPQLGDAERDALGEAMRQFPDSMQRYMLEEGLAEPMPIQQRSVCYSTIHFPFQSSEAQKQSRIDLINDRELNEATM